MSVSCLAVKASAQAGEHRDQLKWLQNVVLNPHRPRYARSLVALLVPASASHLGCGFSEGSGPTLGACLARSVTALMLPAYDISSRVADNNGSQSLTQRTKN